MTNTNKLKALIVEFGFTQEDVAKKLGITVQALNKKINNRSEFKASEMNILINLFDIRDAEKLHDIFFNEKVS